MQQKPVEDRKSAGGMILITLSKAVKSKSVTRQHGKAVASLCKRHKTMEQQEQMLVRGKQRNFMETEKVESRVK
eukprot:8268183-Ditylum_brightwellii.AAC.1